MGLSPLEVVTPIDRIKPRLQHELSPLPIAHDETADRQSFFILREDKIYIRTLQVAKGFDDAVRGDDGLVLLHQGFYPGGCHYVMLDRETRVHDERVLVEEPQEVAVGILGERVSRRDHTCPGGWRFLQIVVLCAGEESLVTCCWGLSVANGQPIDLFPRVTPEFCALEAKCWARHTMLFSVLYPVVLNTLYISLAILLLIENGHDHNWWVSCGLVPP